MNRVKVLLIVLLLVPSVVAAQLQDIIIVDSSGNPCVQMEVGGAPTDLFVVAVYEGLQGMPAAEFQILGIPQEWQVTLASHSLATVVIGDVLHGGGFIVLPICDSGTNSRVTLFTLSIIPMTMETAVLELATHEAPSDPNFTCPLFVDCNPRLGAHCLPSGPRAIINGSESCTVAVESIAWSAMKLLFR